MGVFTIGPLSSRGPWNRKSNSASLSAHASASERRPAPGSTKLSTDITVGPQSTRCTATGKKYATYDRQVVLRRDLPGPAPSPPSPLLHPVVDLAQYEVSCESEALLGGLAYTRTLDSWLYTVKRSGRRFSLVRCPWWCWGAMWHRPGSRRERTYTRAWAAAVASGSGSATA